MAFTQEGLVFGEDGFSQFELLMSRENFSLLMVEITKN